MPAITTPALAGGALAALITAAAYPLGGLLTSEIETRIEIDAPPAAVWSVLAQTDSYGEWNPLLHEMTGMWEEDGRITVSLGTGGNAPVRLSARVVTAEHGTEIVWRERLAGIGGLFDGDHRVHLTETDRGTTLLRHGETFSGVMAPLLFPRIEADAAAGFHAMNAALKARVEAPG
jgi:hypothetical protein